MSSTTILEQQKIARAVFHNPTKPAEGDSNPLASYEILQRYQLHLLAGEVVMGRREFQAQIKEDGEPNPLAAFSITCPEKQKRLIETQVRDGIRHKISIRQEAGEVSVDIVEHAWVAAARRWAPIPFVSRPIDLRVTFAAIAENSLMVQIRQLDQDLPFLSDGVRGAPIKRDQK